MSQHKLDPARRVRFIPLDRKGHPLPKREQARIERKQQKGDRQRAEARALQRQQSELIAQFERQQLETKDWISFAEIIDWRSRQDTNGVPNAENEKVALTICGERFQQASSFTPTGGQLLTSLDSKLTDALLTDVSSLPATAWVTRERWLSWRDIGSDRTIDLLLRSCWVPRALCLKFAASIPFAPKPDWCSHPIEASVSIKAEEPASPLQLPSGPFAQQNLPNPRAPFHAGRYLPCLFRRVSEPPFGELPTSSGVRRAVR